MKNKLKTNKGITLIALVITIIVLLILAGVTIAALSGENRNIKQGSRSKTKNRKRRCNRQNNNAIGRMANGKTYRNTNNERILRRKIW